METSYREILEAARKKLQINGIEEYEVDAWYILQKVFDISKARYYMDCDARLELDDKLCCKFDEMIEKRSRRIPLQYITGSQEFMGLDFKVDENVLIPRQDTEILVETVICDIKKNIFRRDNLDVNISKPENEQIENVNKRLSDTVVATKTVNKKSPDIFDEKIDILDMCTGSGCIAISLDKLCDNVRVCGVDISKGALSVASNNNKNLNAGVTFLESDLFENRELNNRKFNIIVSNPPYIRTAVIDTLMSEVKKHEPIIALDGKNDGLYFYNKIIVQARDYLKLDGRIYFEIGYDQADEVSDLLIKNGYKQVEVIKDLAGLDRVVKAKIS